MPPVARTSSTTSTRSPLSRESRCTSTAETPYSSSNSSPTTAAGSFPDFRTRNEPAAEGNRNRGAEEESARFHPDHLVDPCGIEGGGHLRDRGPQSPAVLEQGGNVPEQYPGFRKVGDISNQPGQSIDPDCADTVVHKDPTADRVPSSRAGDVKMTEPTVTY